MSPRGLNGKGLIFRDGFLQMLETLKKTLGLQELEFEWENDKWCFSWAFISTIITWSRKVRSVSWKQLSAIICYLTPYSRFKNPPVNGFFFFMNMVISGICYNNGKLTGQEKGNIWYIPSIENRKFSKLSKQVDMF